jgi:hypothetical protein
MSFGFSDLASSEFLVNAKYDVKKWFTVGGVTTFNITEVGRLDTLTVKP